MRTRPRNKRQNHTHLRAALNLADEGFVELAQLVTAERDVDGMHVTTLE
jgi:hypothetical protein